MKKLKLSYVGMTILISGWILILFTPCGGTIDQPLKNMTTFQYMKGFGK